MITKENIKSADAHEVLQMMVSEGYVDIYDLVGDLMSMIPDHKLEELKLEMIEYFLED